jgi:ribulose-phosphate 3-epimerase
MDIGSRPRVLYVDDNHDLAESAVELMRLVGFDARFAYDGPSALAVALWFHPDVCILDLNMPGMEGDELAVRLRVQAAGQPVLFVAVTAMGSDESRHRTDAAGFSLHLVKPVDRIVPDFAGAGADIISFHPEASEHVDRTIALIRENGCRAGLVLNPATPLAYLDYTLDKLDLVLVMSVNPGFGGQKFIPGALDKLRAVRQRIDQSGRDIWLEVDGGVKTDNIAEAARAGADTFVCGSAIFGARDYAATIAAMRQALARSAA